MSEIIEWLANINIITVIAAIWAIIEFLQHKKNKKCEILAHYHERYANDHHIDKVLHYYLRTKDNKDGKKSDVPDVHDREMFLRFFEEIELMIQRNYIRKSDVKKLFIFYFMVLWRSNSFWSVFDDDDEINNWRLALKLYLRYVDDESLTNEVEKVRKQIDADFESSYRPNPQMVQENAKHKTF